MGCVWWSIELGCLWGLGTAVGLYRAPSEQWDGQGSRHPQISPWVGTCWVLGWPLHISVPEVKTMASQTWQAVFLQRPLYYCAVVFWGHNWELPT